MLLFPPVPGGSIVMATGFGQSSASLRQDVRRAVAPCRSPRYKAPDTQSRTGDAPDYRGPCRGDVDVSHDTADGACRRLNTTAAATAQVAQAYVTGLRAPMKTLALPDGSLLVSEAGNGPNTGRVSLVDRDGRRFTVIDNLPSGFHGPTLDPTGPTSVLLFGQRLFHPHWQWRCVARVTRLD